MPDSSPILSLPTSSFLEHAFLRWVLAPSVDPAMAGQVTAQREVTVGDRTYRLDYEITGSQTIVAVELDGYEFHSSRPAFSYDRLRQNDIHATGRVVLRFSYDSIRSDTRRCVAQLQALLARDPLLRGYVIAAPIVAVPDDMDPDPLFALSPAPHAASGRELYFDNARMRLNQRTLRECQTQALAALTNYFLNGGRHAACVMAVGAGKTALGVAAALAFTRRRTLIITPGTVIRGTFDRALDPEAIGNVLIGLPGGPLLAGIRPPRVRVLDRLTSPIGAISRDDLLDAEIIVTNFHSLGDGSAPGDLLSKLDPDDIDFLIVDEAHIAAADSYQRMFDHFIGARTLLMSACFQRLDGKPIDADVVFRYRLIDSIADGNAKNLGVKRFAPEVSQTVYEMTWPDGRRSEVVGRDAILAVVEDERRVASITARSEEPIRQVMRTVRRELDRQAEILYPVKPRVLFSAMGEPHAAQIARIATEHGIPTGHVHYSMGDSQVAAIRRRFETDSGDLQGLVHLKMLGQGYDFPPITIVVPMRPYGSFNEFYQFIGRGIRVINDPSLAGRVGPGEQWLNIIYHGELGLDDHIAGIYAENDMDPTTEPKVALEWTTLDVDGAPVGRDSDPAAGPETFVMFERGTVEERVLHDAPRVEQRRVEREREALAQRYAVYAQSSDQAVSFEQFVSIVRQLSD